MATKTLEHDRNLRGENLARKLMGTNQDPPVQKGLKRDAVDIGGTLYRPVLVREDIASRFVALLSVLDATTEDVSRLNDAVMAQAETIQALAAQVLRLQAEAQAQHHAVLSTQTVQQINDRVFEAAADAIDVGEVSVDIQLRSMLVRRDDKGQLHEISDGELEKHNRSLTAGLGAFLDKLSGAKLAADQDTNRLAEVKRRLSELGASFVRHDSIGTAKLTIKNVRGSRRAEPPQHGAARQAHAGTGAGPDGDAGTK